MKRSVCLVAIALALAPVACTIGKTDENQQKERAQLQKDRAELEYERAELQKDKAEFEKAKTVVPAATTPAPGGAAKGGVHELKIQSVANTMAFDLKEMTVATGEQVHLVMHNNSSMEVLPHNWVLVKPGTEAAVAAAGLKTGPSTGYLDDSDTDILVKTPLAAHGDTVEVTFTAPAPGKYPYICTVPGHYMVMKGVLTVTP